MEVFSYFAAFQTCFCADKFDLAVISYIKSLSALDFVYHKTHSISTLSYNQSILMHCFKFLMFVALHATQILTLPSPVKLASINGTIDTADIDLGPEYPVPGLINLYWQPTVISPLTSIDTFLVLEVLRNFCYQIRSNLPKTKVLNKIRFAVTRGEVVVRVAPSEIGPGIIQRQDPNFTITNGELQEWIKDISNRVSRQHASFTPAIVFRLFEKDTPERRSRGTVAIGSITTDPPPALEYPLTDLEQKLEMDSDEDFTS